MDVISFFESHFRWSRPPHVLKTTATRTECASSSREIELGGNNVDASVCRVDLAR